MRPSTAPRRDEDEHTLTIRYGLLAWSICGRAITVVPTHETGWCDGRTIFVDRRDDVRRQVVLQAAMLRAGSLVPDITRQLVGRRTLMRRYLAIEGRRALAGLCEIFPALPPDESSGVSTVPARSAQESLAYARTRGKLADLPEWFGTIKPMRSLRRHAAENAAQDDDLLHAKSESFPAEDQDGDDADDRSGDQPAQDRSNQAFLGENAFTRALSRVFGVQSADTTTARGGGEAASGRHAGMRPGAKGLSGAPAPSTAEPVDGLAGPRTYWYPEWDVWQRAYRPDACRVVELAVDVGRSDWARQSARHDELRRSLAPLGLGLQRHRRRRSGYGLDLDAAIEARVDGLAGCTPSQDVYVDNLRTQRDLSLVVLLDASGSSDEVNGVGSVLYERQRDAAAALIDTLGMLDDRVAGYAFRSHGRDVGFTRIKGFNERSNELAMSRLATVYPGGYTRLGAAVRHVTAELLDRCATRHRLIVLISDGFPYDHGYEGTYATADAAKSVDEARFHGIGCVCLNFDSATDAEVLSRVFGRGGHVTACDVDEVAPRMRSLFVHALEIAKRESSSAKHRHRPRGGLLNEEMT